MKESSDFATGIAFLLRYFTEETKVEVFEQSFVSVTKLQSMPAESLQILKNLNWNCGHDVDGDGFAEYLYLKYLYT